MKFGVIISIKLYIKYNLITSLSNDIDTVKADLVSHKNGEDYLSITWERGSIDTSGNDVASNTSIRTIGYIDLAENPDIDQISRDVNHSEDN